MPTENIFHNIVVIGASGAIGGAFIDQLRANYPGAQVHAGSRQRPARLADNVVHHPIDYQDEETLAQAAQHIAQSGPIDMIIVATGLLHTDALMPEKALRDITADKMHQLFAANTVLPSLVAKHFLPHIPKDRKAVFAALSARVGSISDNQLGGWYAYRASKAALNMMIKTTSIEVGRRFPHAVIVGLHPGTVDSGLSKPFQKQVPDEKLFTPDQTARYLLDVLYQLTPADTGKCWAWDGVEINP